MNPILHNAHLDGSPFLFEGNNHKAVILFHGLTATPVEVRRLGETLHAAGYTVDGPLLPGHGTDPADLNRVKWKDWTQLAQAHFDILTARYKQVIVGGESTGALLALWLSANNPGVFATLAYAPALRLRLTPYQVALLYLAAPFGYQSPKKGLESDSSWQGYKVHTAHGVVELVRLQRVVRSQLRQVTQPLLLVQGSQDRTIHPGCSRSIKSLVSSALVETAMMPASGHCVLLDKEFERVADLTLDFLDRIECSKPPSSAAN